MAGELVVFRAASAWRPGGPSLRTGQLLVQLLLYKQVDVTTSLERCSTLSGSPRTVSCHQLWALNLVPQFLRHRSQDISPESQPRTPTAPKSQGDSPALGPQH